MDYTKDITVTKGTQSDVTLTGELPFELLTAERQAAIKALGKNIEIDGFRKGHVPESELVKRLGEMAILAEMAERALAKAYPAMVAAHKLDVIGQPQVSITKIAPDNPLGFTITVAILPEITLPDYTAIAKKLNQEKASTEVTDEEVDQQVKDILRQKLAYERLQQKAAEKQKHDEDVTELPTPETVETHTHADGTVHAGPAHDEDPEIADAELPELTDEYVKTLGQPGQFESVDDFKAKLREHLAIEKEREVNAAHRAKITDAIIEKTSVTLPTILIDSEMHQMFAQMEDDLTRANLSLDDYLAHIKKTRDELRKEWEPAAVKRATLQLILNDIAKKENVSADTSLVDEQVDALKERYKDADEARVRVYVESVLTNEAVMQKLEEAQ